MTDFRKTNEWRKARSLAIKLWSGPCPLCLTVLFPDLKNSKLSTEVDHRFPVARGGEPFDQNNLQLTHKVCNYTKGDRLESPQVFKECRLAISSIINKVEEEVDWLNL